MTLLGIDVSGWQAGIDMATVPADFAIIKATGGTGYASPALEAQLEASRADGKLVGFYHFAHEKGFEGTAQAEASHFLRTIRPLWRPGDMLVLDWEGDNVADLAWAATWLREVETALAVAPVIYMNGEAESLAWPASVTSHYPLWLAWYPTMARVDGYQVPSAPRLDRWKTMLLWQFTATGRLAGYDANLDLNIFYGGKADWLALSTPPQKGSTMAATDVFPVPTSMKDQISAKFGSNRGNPDFPWQYDTGHWGTDYAVPAGTPVRAIADGVVLWADWGDGITDNALEYKLSLPDNDSSASGIVVYVDHGDWVSTYAHLSRTDLNAGDRVRRGDTLGFVGSTGRAMGAHLHFECILPGSRGTNLAQGIIYSRYDGELQIAAENKAAALAAPAPAKIAPVKAAPAKAEAKRSFLWEFKATGATVRDEPTKAAKVLQTYPAKAGQRATVTGCRITRDKAGKVVDVWYRLSHKFGGITGWVNRADFVSHAVNGLPEV